MGGQDPGELVPLLYGELRRLAHHYMRGERSDHVLQTTALVNEAYLRLAQVERVQFRDRTHFMAVAATQMRRILVDHARARGADKRGGGVEVGSLEQIAGTLADASVDVTALDAALEELARFDPRQARIVELRFFGGLSIAEVADALDISPATVGREWVSARAWLYHHLSE